MVQIITFYKFTDLSDLPELRGELVRLMKQYFIKGTIILANEGVNATVSGDSSDIAAFVDNAAVVLKFKIVPRTLVHSEIPFRRIDVKIKDEIVTLKQPVEMTYGEGTHVSPQRWNDLLSDPETVVLDARNHYEHETGTFESAIDPGTSKFSELPEFVTRVLDPKKHKKIAMFCTGGIRCEKFAPYMKHMGFEEVYQLEGGILRYLAETQDDASLWKGECFVFDSRISVDVQLTKGSSPDHSVKPGK